MHLCDLYSRREGREVADDRILEEREEDDRPIRTLAQVILLPIPPRVVPILPIDLLDRLLQTGDRYQLCERGGADRDDLGGHRLDSVLSCVPVQVLSRLSDRLRDDWVSDHFLLVWGIRGVVSVGQGREGPDTDHAVLAGCYELVGAQEQTSDRGVVEREGLCRERRTGRAYEDVPV